MLKKAVLGLCAALVASALLANVFAAAPEKVGKVAPIASLVTEAEAKIAALEPNLGSKDNYDQQKKSIAGDAGVLAVLAQAVAEHDGSAAWKKSAPDLRDAAIALRTATSYDEAKKAFDAVKAAQSGKSSGAKADYEWNKLSKLSGLMVEVNKRTGKLRKAAKKGLSAPEETARDASVLAVLSLAAEVDTHEVKSGKKEDLAKWAGYAKEMQASATAAADAATKKDEAGFKAAFEKAGKSCSECHKAFRAE